MDLTSSCFSPGQPYVAQACEYIYFFSWSRNGFERFYIIDTIHLFSRVLNKYPDNSVKSARRLLWNDYMRTLTRVNQPAGTTNKTEMHEYLWEEKKEVWKGADKINEDDVTNILIHMLIRGWPLCSCSESRLNVSSISIHSLWVIRSFYFLYLLFVALSEVAVNSSLDNPTSQTKSLSRVWKWFMCVLERLPKKNDHILHNFHLNFKTDTFAQIFCGFFPPWFSQLWLHISSIACISTYCLFFCHVSKFSCTWTLIFQGTKIIDKKSSTPTENQSDWKHYFSNRYLIS